MPNATQRRARTFPVTFTERNDGRWVTDRFQYFSDVQWLRAQLQERTYEPLEIDYAEYLGNGRIQPVYTSGYIITAPNNPTLSIIATLRPIKCKVCAMTFHRVASPNYGSDRENAAARHSHLCQNCRRQKSYSHKDFRRKYQPKETTKGTVRFGFELELVQEGDAADYVRVMDRLIQAGFERTSDGTVDDEFKSPIYYLPYLPGNLKKLLTTASDHTQNEHVGTHIHVSLGDYDLHRALTRDNKPFFELEAYLAEHRRQTEQVWGRYFGHYREFPMHNGHGSWLNNHGETLEWRLPRLTSYEQFSKLVKWILTVCQMVAQERHAGVPTYRISEHVVKSYTATFGEVVASSDFRDAYEASGFSEYNSERWSNSDWYDYFSAESDDSEDEDEEW